MTERISVRVYDEAVLDQVDGLVDDGVYPNRSAAIRAALADFVDGDGGDDGDD